MKSLNIYSEITADNLAQGFRSLAESENDKVFNNFIVEVLRVSQHYWNGDTLPVIKKYINSFESNTLTLDK